MALSSTLAFEELDAIVKGSATLENWFEVRPMQSRLQRTIEFYFVDRKRNVPHETIHGW